MTKTIIRVGLGIIGLISIVSLQSCQIPTKRHPASSGGNFLTSSGVEESYGYSIELDYLHAEEKKLVMRLKNSTNSTSEFGQNELTILREKIQSIESKQKRISLSIQAEANDLNSDKPLSQWGSFTKNWQRQKEKIIINNPEHYVLNNDGKIIRTFTMDLSGTTDYQLGIINKFWNSTKEKSKDDDETSNDIRHYFEAQIKCDADFKLKKKIFSKTITKNKQINFKIYEQKNNSPKVVLYFNQKVKSCDVLFKNPEYPEKSYGVRLISNIDEKNQISLLRNRFEACILPDSQNLKGVEKLFLTPKYTSMTCAEEVQQITTLEEPIDGLKSRAQVLLGQQLPENFINEMNPYGALDFSKAPKLKTILISYLVFRHDFYGTLIARLAKWHADHGTQVRIIMSDVISNKKDRLMLHDLIETSNNIKVQEYRYDSENGGVWDHLSELHRTMHVKLFITLADNPSDNVVYFGGRNIHDGFVFMKTPDNSAYPDLIQYGEGKDKDEGFAPWRDYEMQIHSVALAEQVASHYLTLWQRDSQSFYVRSINKNIVSKTLADPAYFKRANDSTLIRHFMSVPFKDNEALENFYIDIFESAEKSVRLSTPYFRPTKKLGDAIQRAVARGVDISLITRLDLSGDTAAIILSEVNKAGVNRFLNKIKIFEYTEPGVILHSKVVLVDGKISFIGSVNLNKRSFVHDMEDVAMIYNSNYNKKMHQILDVYLKQSREITEVQKIAFWKKVVIGIFDKEL
ncbi:MAG: phosphatidylserine/phosphatidylglycerophosphate/cardiolipin synthase family protein [Bacteriovorax sp.]|nr:phosphatidylserine/phosphatidylglycerophosphate/cardiolipin synthase family protein [Bacteriovorax sp.]